MKSFLKIICVSIFVMFSANVATSAQDEAYELGVSLSDKGDYLEAAKQFEIAAEDGNLPAMTKLGELYYKKLIPDETGDKAFQLFTKAADLGDPVAQYNLALCYENGIGTEKDTDAASLYYKFSADQGHELASEKYLELNPDAAKQQESPKQPEPPVQKPVTEAKQPSQIEGSDDYKSAFSLYEKGEYKEAVKAFTSLANKRSAEGQYGLGLCYEEGKGVESSLTAAITFYKMAAAQGYEPANIKLAKLAPPKDSKEESGATVYDTAEDEAPKPKTEPAPQPKTNPEPKPEPQKEESSIWDGDMGDVEDVENVENVEDVEDGTSTSTPIEEPDFRNSPSPVPARRGYVQAVVWGVNVNLRSSPTTNTDRNKMGYLRNREYLTWQSAAISEHEYQGIFWVWHRVTTSGGRTGYVRSDYVRINGRLTGKNVNVRDNATLNSQVIKNLRGNETFVCVRSVADKHGIRDEKGRLYVWHRIAVNGRELGWVSSQYVQFQ